MSHYLYILYSSSTDKYYTGESHDPAIRIKLHNEGASKSTKHGIPWVLVYTELYPDRSSALKREKEIKRMKSRKYILELIRNCKPSACPDVGTRGHRFDSGILYITGSKD